MEISLCNILLNKNGRNTKMCKDNVPAYTYEHPAGRYFLSVLFPSATVGCDTAEITERGSKGTGRKAELRRLRLPTNTQFGEVRNKFSSTERSSLDRKC